jgi:hypothetical protein
MITNSQDMIGNQLTLYLLLVFMAVDVQAALKQPRNLLGLQIGMSEDEVRGKLRKIGKQQKEEKERGGEEGEQEVWMLERDSRFDYLVARFDGQHQLSFMTAVARRGLGVRYADVADLKDARHATDGLNHVYTWTIAASGKRAGYVLVARGSHPELLTSYSLYPLRSRN